MVESETIRAWGEEQRRVPLMAHARAYTRRGWAVVPLWWVARPERIDQETGEVFGSCCACPRGEECTSAGKHPHTKHGSREPLVSGIDTDLYWTRHPLCNIGIATGESSGIVVLDIDPDKGGWDSFHQLLRRYGPVPETCVSVTGSGGRHVFFEWPGEKTNNAIGYMPGIDVRGDGGLVVVPPSLHLLGVRYTWHKDGHPRTSPIAELPLWMGVFLEEGGERKRRRRNYQGGNAKFGRVFDPNLMPMIPDGERNDTLCSIAGRLIWEAREADEVMATVHKINQTRCTPPLPANEVTRLVQHACRRWGPPVPQERSR